MAFSRMKFFFLLVSAGAAMLPALAHAQSVRDIDNRMRRLENEIETLSRAIYRGEAPPPRSGDFSGDASIGAQYEVRLQQMETELQQLRGTLEEQSYEIRQLKKQFEVLSGDLDVRLKDLEGGGAAAAPGGIASFSNNTAPEPQASGTLGTINENAGQSGAQSGSFGSGAVSVGKNPASQYEHAFSLLKASNYDAAEQEFSQFLTSHPDHALAGNAKYWLGETFYVRGHFEQAARVFAEGYQQYPEGPKAADNLLKLGMSLAATGNASDACVALIQLKKQYADGAGPVLRRADQEMQKLGC